MKYINVGFYWNDMKLIKKQEITFFEIVILRMFFGSILLKAMTFKMR